MDFGLERVLTELKKDPIGFADRCEADYERQVLAVAQRIYDVRDRRPIVLLAGPSGSGKTTTAIKLTNALRKLGIGSVSVSMDSYFLDYTPETAPRAADGSRDMESPLGLDLKLMGQQFRDLTEGKEVMIPSFDFGRERRAPEKSTPLRLGQDEVAIFEGINALNDMVTEFDGVYSFKLYVSVVSGLTDGEKLLYSPQTARLIRRIIRDYNFRSASPEYTLTLWKNVIRGERLYIEPNKGKADCEINTFLAYEPAALKCCALPLIKKIPELDHVCQIMDRFPDFDNSLIPTTSLLREFIGGSVYQY